MNPDGEGVFETLKVVDGLPIALSRHLARLIGGASRLGLDAPDLAAIHQAIDRELTNNPWSLGRLRITWTARSVLEVESRAAALPSPTASVLTSDWRRDEGGPLVGIKSTLREGESEALEAVQIRGADEALIANRAGDLCEGTTSNIFYVIDRELRTPALSAGCLPGIARALVLEWFGAREVAEPIVFLNRATEAFLTSSLRDVQPIATIDGRSYPAPGPITQRVQATWQRAATADP